MSAFIANIFQYTVLKSDQELSVLNLLDKNGMLRPSIAAQSKGNQNASESKSPKNQTGAHGKVCVACETRSIACASYPQFESFQARARKLSEELSIPSPKVVHKVCSVSHWFCWLLELRDSFICCCVLFATEETR